MTKTTEVSLGIRAAVAAAALLQSLVLTAPAHAVCGDVTGDGNVLTSDALKVLQTAVGQDVPMTCQDQPIVNFMGYANSLTCNGYGFNSTMTWSEHDGMTWKDYSQPYLPYYPVFQRVDDLAVGGKIILSLGDCGSVKFNLDSWDIVFPMPATGGAFVPTEYQPSSNTIFLILNLASIDQVQFSTPPPDLVAGAGSGSGDQGARPRMAIASVQAPPGIGAGAPLP